MDRFTTDLRDLVHEFRGLTVDSILASIAGPHQEASESRHLAMRSIRFSINHRSPPDHLTPIDIQTIEPLIRDLVKMGLQGGGLPSEALAAFEADGPATPD